MLTIEGYRTERAPRVNNRDQFSVTDARFGCVKKEALITNCYLERLLVLAVVQEIVV